MRFFNFFGFFGRNTSDSSQAPQPQVVKQAAREALKQYEKTFIDLARYDRGETPLVSIPR